MACHRKQCECYWLAVPLGEERDSKTIKEQSGCGKRCPAYMKAFCEQPNPTAKEVRREQGSAIVYRRIGPGAQGAPAVCRTRAAHALCDQHPQRQTLKAHLQPLQSTHLEFHQPRYRQQVRSERGRRWVNPPHPRLGAPTPPTAPTQARPSHVPPPARRRTCGITCRKPATCPKRWRCVWLRLPELAPVRTK